MRFTLIATIAFSACLSCGSDSNSSSQGSGGSTQCGDFAPCSGSGGLGATGGTTSSGGSGGLGSGGVPGSGGSATGGSDPGTGGVPAGSCDPGSADTEWATTCAVPDRGCVAGSWTAPAEGSDGHPLQHESEHFAIYYYTSDPDGGDVLEGLSPPLSSGDAQQALDTLEMIWDAYFGEPIGFPEPYCDSSTKWKAAVHFDDFYPLWGGGFGCGGDDCMGLWVGRGAAADQWGLAHEFMHGVQSTTQAFPDCGGDGGCWIFESHANWMPHQIFRDNPHCSEMLVNMPHLYYGNTRDRYCNWQFFEFLKDKHCHQAVHDMWAYDAPDGQRDPWQKLMLSRGWNIEQLNDVFGEWAMHNVTWDYRDPEAQGGSDQGAIYREEYGPVDDTGGRAERRLRLTRLEPLDDAWADNRRFVSPYYWAPQRWGYNVVELHPEAGADRVQVSFRGVTQTDADSGWRYGLVATDENLTTSRYSALGSGTDGELDFCVTPGEQLYLVVVATPTEYQKIVWDRPSDGPAYPSIYRYPYMVQIAGAWPQGFDGGQLDACPDGTQRHGNGGGCAPGGTSASVYVGPYARILGGTVSGSARIEDQATVINGMISGGTVGALSLIGTGNGRTFDVSDSAVVQTTFYPLGWFGDNQFASGTARVLGDVEFVASGVSNDVHYGMVDGNQGVSSVTDVTVAPPYAWR